MSQIPINSLLRSHGSKKPRHLRERGEQHQIISYQPNIHIKHSKDNNDWWECQFPPTVTFKLPMIEARVRTNTNHLFFFYINRFSTLITMNKAFTSTIKRTLHEKEIINMIYQRLQRLYVSLQESNQHYQHPMLTQLRGNNVPYPEWRPFLLASFIRRARDLEWILVGFLIMKPSLASFLMFWPEQYSPISATSYRKLNFIEQDNETHHININYQRATQMIFKLANHTNQIY